MSTVTIPNATATQLPPDLRTRTRWFAAILMPIGPLAVAILRFILPYNTTDSATAIVTKVAAHPGQEKAVLWLTVVAFLTLVPGAYAAIKLASRRAPVLAAVAACMVIPGYLSLVGVALIDDVAFAGVTHHVNQASVTTLSDLVNKLPTTSLLSNIFVAGHLIGTVVLAFALRRARAVPTAGWVILAVSQPLHLVAAMSGNHVLDLIGWGMTAIGMAYAAVAVTRTRNDDWDLPPLPR